MIHTYLFEAKSIQPYIFATNKLKEIIGGSELIEQITSETGLLKQTLSSLELEEGKDIDLSRCGGAAFYAFSSSEKSINKLANFWPLVFRQYAPDLEFTHAEAKDDNAIQAFQKAHDALMADRNRPKTKLPQASVFTLRFGRTGEPVTKLIPVGGNAERMDQVTARKRDFAKSKELAERVMWDSHQGEWPVNLTHEEGQNEKNFPFSNDNQLIGLIHADGNGVGQLLMDLKEVAYDKGNDAITDKNYIAVFKAISESIKKATEAASAEAVSKVLFPNMQDGLFPARPIVLGGDDLTMIVRADLALPFTQAFLKAFEEQSQLQFEALRKKDPDLKSILPEKLTACAGIVYAKASQPFSALHDLAEGLCKHAKKTAKKDENLLQHEKFGKKQKTVPSSLSFYRVTSTLMDDFDEVLKRELTTGNIVLSRGCYTLEPHGHLPNLTDLLELQKFLEQSEISSGALRQITSLLHQSTEQAQSRYRRWKEVMIYRDEKEKKNNWKTFDELRCKLSQPHTEFDINQQQSVPFEDVLSLSAVGNNLNPEQGAQV